MALTLIFPINVSMAENNNFIKSLTGFQWSMGLSLTSDEIYVVDGLYNKILVFSKSDIEKNIFDFTDYKNEYFLNENKCVGHVHGISVVDEKIYAVKNNFDCIAVFDLSGNFVVGLGLQVWNGHRVIWAATMNANSPGEQRGVSFTTDDGDTWRTTLLGERVYNVSAFDSLVFVCSGSGLWKTIVHHPDDPLVWARYQPMVEHTEFYNQEILTNEVYTAVVDDRSYFPNKTLWVGTPDGLARLKNSDEITWDIFRVETDQNKRSPCSPKTHMCSPPLRGRGEQGELAPPQAISGAVNFCPNSTRSPPLWGGV